MAELRIDGLGKAFGKVTALERVDLDVADGSFVVLLGPSGCGKSTLLRLIAGLETPSAGRVVLGGRDLSGVAPERRDLTLMFQSYALLPHLSIVENVRFPLRMAGQLPKAEQYRQAREALALVQLEALAERRPRQLSGGQQQRAALARALVAKPGVLLLDEPLSNLDARLRDEMQIELKKLHARLGLTTIMVTHDQTEALALADTVVLMNAGRVEQTDPPARLYERPHSRFAADFIGAANVLELQVDGSPGAWSATLADGQRVALAGDGWRAGRCAAMLRQEAIVFGGATATTPASGSTPRSRRWCFSAR